MRERVGEGEAEGRRRGVFYKSQTSRERGAATGERENIVF